MVHRYGYAALVVGLLFARGVEAQGVVGRVLGPESQPVALALVQVLGVDGSVLAVGSSAADGRFRIDVPRQSEPVTLTVETLFHRAARLDSLRVASADFVAIPDIVLEPINLDEITVDVVRGRLAPGREWIRRNQSEGKGTFLSGALVALSAGSSIGAYVAAQTGLFVRYDERARATLINPAGAVSRCVQVMVNRWKIERTGFESIDRIPRDEIAAIEIYEAERDLPPGYYFDARQGCGIVNVWLWNAW